MKYIVVFILLLSSIFARVINFSPLPVDKAPKLFVEYEPLLKYLEQETGYKFKFNYSKNYVEIIEKFESGQLDIIELGPLPYVKLKEKYTDAYAFLTFLSKKGKDSYTCEFVSTDKNIKSIQDINKDVNIKLTRKLSTCGYLMSEFILQNSGKSLKNLNYEYVGAHTKVLLDLLLEENTAGTAKSTIVDKYEHFNFTKLGSSPSIPGFAFVANKKTISNEEIKNIQKALLKLHPLENKEDKKFVSNWSENTKYGCRVTKKHAYKEIFDAIKLIKIPRKSKK